MLSRPSKPADARHMLGAVVKSCAAQVTCFSPATASLSTEFDQVSLPASPLTRMPSLSHQRIQSSRRPAPSRPTPALSPSPPAHHSPIATVSRLVPELKTARAPSPRSHRHPATSAVRLPVLWSEFLHSADILFSFTSTVFTCLALTAALKE